MDIVGRSYMLITSGSYRVNCCIVVSMSLTEKKNSIIKVVTLLSYYISDFRLKGFETPKLSNS